MRSTLIDAIKGRLVLELEYEPGGRLVEPHALGITKDGNLVLRAYQVDGASASGEHENWKLFRVDRMTSARLTSQIFLSARPDYNPNDSAMKGGVIACL